MRQCHGEKKKHRIQFPQRQESRAISPIKYLQSCKLCIKVDVDKEVKLTNQNYLGNFANQNIFH